MSDGEPIDLAKRREEEKEKQKQAVQREFLEGLPGAYRLHGSHGYKPEPRSDNEQRLHITNTICSMLTSHWLQPVNSSATPIIEKELSEIRQFLGERLKKYL